MMGTIIRYSLALIIGSALGLSSALYMAGLRPGAQPLDFGDVEVDGWRSDFAIGSKSADPYTRARVARHGLLALAKSEAVYFTRTTDDAGDLLREECDYRMVGGKMPANWWSITLYDARSMLPINDDKALSIDATSITGDPENWTVLIAAEPPNQQLDRISSRNAGKFDLTLRLYVPDEALIADPEASFTPPAIERLSCEGESQ